MSNHQKPDHTRQERIIDVGLELGRDAVLERRAEAGLASPPASPRERSREADSGISEEVEMLRRIIRRVYQLAVEEESLEKLEHAAQTLSTAINRLGCLVKLQLELGTSDRDEFIASFNEALEIVSKELRLKL